MVLKNISIVAVKGLRMLRVAIVGCGKIADSHAIQLQRIKECKIVGVCDSEILMARQLSERFNIGRSYDDLNSLLKETCPDVVHITTPPQSHLEIGLMCLENGCHIYVEKPFTLNTFDAEILLKTADQKGCKITVGHDAQFSEVACRLRKLVKIGYIGDKPLHLESVWCYDLSDVTYAKSLLNDKAHWTRKLPGGLLHNIISHGIAKIAEFFTSDEPKVFAYGFVSPYLRDLGEEYIVDELRVILHEEMGTTAFFTFSSQMQPSLHNFTIYGSKNGLQIDEDQRTLIELKGKRYKSYAEHFVPPLIFAKQYYSNFVHNVKRFLAMDFHMDYGKKLLIESFYKSISNGTPVPIPYREILLTSKIMDSIFDQINEINKNFKTKDKLKN